MFHAILALLEAIHPGGASCALRFLKVQATPRERPSQ